MLRRKGRLKEQDKFIDFMLKMHDTHTCIEVMEKIERWVNEHRENPKLSTLRRLVPTLGKFFTPLKMVEAFQEYDKYFQLSRRKFIKPNFAELRHILNIAQVCRGLVYQTQRRCACTVPSLVFFARVFGSSERSCLAMLLYLRYLLCSVLRPPLEHS